MKDAFRMGYAQALIDYGKLTPYISVPEAKLLYGRKSIERWIKAGNITILKETAKSNGKLDRAALVIIAAASLNIMNLFLHFDFSFDFIQYL